MTLQRKQHLRQSFLKKTTVRTGAREREPCFTSPHLHELNDRVSVPTVDSDLVDLSSLLVLEVLQPRFTTDCATHFLPAPPPYQSWRSSALVPDADFRKLFRLSTVSIFFAGWMPAEIQDLLIDECYNIGEGGFLSFTDLKHTASYVTSKDQQHTRYMEAAFVRPDASSTSSLQHDRHSETRSVSLMLSSSLLNASGFLNSVLLLCHVAPPAVFLLHQSHLVHFEHTRVSVNPSSRQLAFFSASTPLVASSRAREAIQTACWSGITARTSETPPLHLHLP